MLTTQQELERSLEDLLDRHGLDKVLSALSTVAAEKADHVQSNWGDSNDARAWMRVSRWADRQRTHAVVLQCPLS